MTTEILSPRLELLTQEYVLVQAWKKSAAYIRYHNWYSDTLALDMVAINLPAFLKDLAERLRDFENWESTPLRVVPAPKSQEWRISRVRGWGPVEAKKTAKKLRPLAHVVLRDQVAATAIMLCLADRVETLQGDTRHTSTPSQRRRVLSYGNRLLCDSIGGRLRHRWGSTSLYRAYYQDYRSFLSRAAIVGDAVLKQDERRRVMIVTSDLRQFFDRVRPRLLSHKLREHSLKADDHDFYRLARRVLHWTWSSDDQETLADYRANTELADFASVALPQGLVASGFFSNIALIDFDAKLRAALGAEWMPGVRLEDATRYVDDLRFVVSDDGSTPLDKVEDFAKQWVQTQLDATAPDLRVADDKTIATEFRGEKRTMVRQSRKMARIQAAVSGGFDAIGGEEILEAVQGLIRSQKRFSESSKSDSAWTLSPVPDVRDATVARFAAARFRTTFRSLRPLLPDGAQSVDPHERSDPMAALERTRVTRTKAALDDDARAFALGLIEQWIEDPSNVRLLRIGLDLWPAEDVLRNVLGLLRPHLERRGGRRASRQVAWYCLSEIFRAGATETGMVADEECVASGLDVTKYRAALSQEAERLLRRGRGLPWYLRQQVYLFLAASGEVSLTNIRMDRVAETKHYRQLLRFLHGKSLGIAPARRATFAVLVRRAFRDMTTASEVLRRSLHGDVLSRIARVDPGFAVELRDDRTASVKDFTPRQRLDLCLGPRRHKGKWRSLPALVFATSTREVLRNDLALSEFAAEFLEVIRQSDVLEAVVPDQVLVTLGERADGLTHVTGVRIEATSIPPDGSLYRAPSWATKAERWRFQLGFLLRFILTCHGDFTRRVNPSNWREGRGIYRSPESHWLQRLYSLYSAQGGFGEDWLPMSDWTESLLYGLLRWPGCVPRELDKVVNDGVEATLKAIRDHIATLNATRGPSTGVLMLRTRAPWPRSEPGTRALRACVAQTVVPGPDDFEPSDLTLSRSAMRSKHRNHLSAALAAVERMLVLRDTHMGQGSRLDLLILPELAVHPLDVRSHLIPFARRHKTIILAGMVYEYIKKGEPLVNSALWVLPRLTPTRGLEMLTRRQCKLNLAELEQRFNKPSTTVHGCRSCQWLVGYEWSSDASKQALWLTAAICYDATDLRLASDLRDASDVFIIPALNQDVATFDHMAAALHYHMYQMVVVANNGLFGGSNAHAPYRDTYRKQVFHLHGQPQASVAFLEIDDIQAFLNRRKAALEQASAKAALPVPPLREEIRWKYPPAGNPVMGS